MDSQKLSKYRQTFDRDGFVVVPNLLNPALLAELRQQIDAVLDGTVQPGRQGVNDFHIQWEPRVVNNPEVARRDKVRVVFHLAHTHPWFWNLAVSNVVLEVVEALIGPEIRYYTDQTFMKPARHGSEVPWHQDSAYWPDAEPRLLSCWLAIDDVTIENGCVRFIPGSHRQELGHDTIETDLPNRITTKAELVDPSQEVPVEMTAGSACFHHSLTVHRSLPNTSARCRRGLVLIYLPADLQFYRPWEFMYGFPLVRSAAGRPLDAPPPFVSNQPA